MLRVRWTPGPDHRMLLRDPIGGPRPGGTAWIDLVLSKGKTVELTHSSRNDPLHSDLSGDPDMQDLLQSFVEQLPNRAAAMAAALSAGEFDQLKVLAHQLKGAAGSYGFTPISEVCRLLEESVLGGDPAEMQVALGRVTELCRRATHLPPS